MSIPQTIRSPHLFRPNDLTYTNAWNANATATLRQDRAVVKTVYDPCPPGYSLPHMWAFSNFYRNGTSTPIGSPTHANTNAKDVTGDNTLTAADFGNEDGWYFYTGYGTNTIFFPGTCGRYAGEDHLSHVRYFHNAYVWTAALDDNYGPCGFDLYYSADGATWYASGTVNGLTIRPVAE
jgi:hypothetical protein